MGRLERGNVKKGSIVHTSAPSTVKSVQNNEQTGSTGLSAGDQQRITDLEIALLNTKKERNKEKSKFLVDKLKAMPELKVPSIDKKNHRKVLALHADFINTITTCKIGKFDENGRLPADQRDLDASRDLK